MQVIIGPAFNIDAYNWGVVGNKDKGIKSQKERGVLSMDQQYNAFNFVYFVLRSNNSYERKVSTLQIFARYYFEINQICTSRLSFYIEEYHGSRVFPANIESQISLFIYRDNRLSKRAGKYPEDQRMELLARAIKYVLAF